MRIPPILLRLLAILLVVGLAPLSASGQSPDSAETAVRLAVATAHQTDPDALIVRVVADSGDWVYASATIPAGDDDHGPHVYYVLAHNDGGWSAELRYTAAFDALLAQSPPGFPTPTVRSALAGFNLAGDGSADLSFPFPVGERWRFNGPHPNGGGTQRSSLDFYFAQPGAPGFAQNAPVLSMRGGTVDRPCANLVAIDHGGGWSTFYYHVINITVADGEVVQRGQRLGGTSDRADCGGFANGPHMHVWMTFQGAEVPFAGKDIGGWTVSNGGQPYDGCLSRGSQVLCAQNFDSVLNDGVSGSLGSVSISPTRSTVNNWITYQVDALPANTTGQIQWRRLSGSIVTIDTLTTNGSGVASGQFRVPATPGGPNQQVRFTAGGTTRTATFEVAPRIKVNTSPAIRGRQADVSLRGYTKNETVRIRWLDPTRGWIQLATVTTSNTGSANVWVTVPAWAPNGLNSVRGDGTVFRQQTNAVQVSGGAFSPASETSPTPDAPVSATPLADPGTPVVPTATDTPVTIDRSTLPPQPAIVEMTASQWTIEPTTGAVISSIDLGSPFTLSSIAWLTTTAGCHELLRIETSVDGDAWNVLHPIPALTPSTWQALNVNADARFVRWVSSAPDAATANGCPIEVAFWGSSIALEPTPSPVDTSVDGETGTPVPASTDTPGA